MASEPAAERRHLAGPLLQASFLSGLLLFLLNPLASVRLHEPPQPEAAHQHQPDQRRQAETHNLNLNASMSPVTISSRSASPVI